MADSTQTICSVVETSLLFRLSSLSMLRDSHQPRSTHSDGNRTATSQTEPSITPAPTPRTPVTTPDVTQNTYMCKLAPRADL